MIRQLRIIEAIKIFPFLILLHFQLISIYKSIIQISLLIISPAIIRLTTGLTSIQNSIQSFLSQLIPAVTSPVQTKLNSVKHPKQLKSFLNLLVIGYKSIASILTMKDLNQERYMSLLLITANQKILSIQILHSLISMPMSLMKRSKISKWGLVMRLRIPFQRFKKYLRSSKNNL